MENYEWAKEMNCAVTVCDAEGVIIYMNDKSRETQEGGRPHRQESHGMPLGAFARNNPPPA